MNAPEIVHYTDEIIKVGTGLKAVAVGGGSGIPATIRALMTLGFQVSAVVAMGDDGGSTGILRRETGMLPPGDIRNCLVAMSEDPEGLWQQVFQYRLPAADGTPAHAVGNLVLLALTDVTNSFPEAIAQCGRVLKSRGHVYPSTLENIVLLADMGNGETLRGQAVVGKGQSPIIRVYTEPDAPAAYPPAVEALESADVIVLGPGSLYTSVIPNLLVDGITDAIRRSDAVVVAVSNVANVQAETRDLDAADHVQALIDHGLEGRIDCVLVNQWTSVEEDPSAPARVAYDDAIRERIERLGPCVEQAQMVLESDPVRHASALLAPALEKVFTTCRSLPK